jgi:hypothetical protein
MGNYLWSTADKDTELKKMCTDYVADDQAFSISVHVISDKQMTQEQTARVTQEINTFNPLYVQGNKNFFYAIWGSITQSSSALAGTFASNIISHMISQISTRISRSIDVPYVLIEVEVFVGPMLGHLTAISKHFGSTTNIG